MALPPNFYSLIALLYLVCKLALVLLVLIWLWRRRQPRKTFVDITEGVFVPPVEIGNSENSRRGLIITLNQCFCDFGQKTFRLLSLMEMARQNRPVLESCLEEWQREGYLKIIKPLVEAKPEDYCIEVLKPIEGSPY